MPSNWAMVMAPGRESVLLKAVDNVVICLDIEDAGFGPWQNVLKRMVDHIRKIASGKGRGCAGTKVLLLDRNHLDGVAGLLVEVVCHRLLLGKTLGLVLGRPEPDCVSTRDTGNQGGNHRGRRRYQNWSHDGTPPEFPVFDCRSSAGPRPILNWWVGRSSPHKRGTEEFLAVAGLGFALDKLDQHVSQHASGGLQRLTHRCKWRVEPGAEVKPVISNDRNFTARAQSGFADGLHGAYRNNIGHAAHGSWHGIQLQKPFHRTAPAFETEFGCLAILRRRGKTGLFQATSPSFGALTCKIIDRRPADMRDMTMSETGQMRRHFYKSAFIVDIDPGRIGAVIRPAVRHKGDIQFAQYPETWIVAVGSGNHEAAQMTCPRDLLEDFHFLLDIVRRKDCEIPTPAGKRRCKTGNQFAKEGLRQLPVLCRHDIANGIGFSGRKAPRVHVRLIAELLRRFPDELLCPACYVLIVIESARDRTFRQAQTLGNDFQLCRLPH